MDEKDFELFCTLDSTCNITYAAEKLHVSQSALSKRIKMMEKKCWTLLFFALVMSSICYLVLPEQF